MQEQDLLRLTRLLLSMFAPVDSNDRSLKNTESLMEVAMFVAN
jgi:hypothetical protein